MFKLKSYQLSALTALKEFLSIYKEKGVFEAYSEACYQNGWKEVPYHDYFKEAPSICLRVPTGGGKTIIAASAIKILDEGTRETGAPVVLWLTPSDAITTQTYEALSDPKHPYRESLETQYPGKVQIRDLNSITTLDPCSFGKECIIVVSTIQSFNIEKKELRNVYSYNEELDRFFIDLTPEEAEELEKVDEEDVEEFPEGVLKKFNVGEVKLSIANLLRRYHPILVVDEAHNNRTEKFFNSLNRIAPSSSLELTATPQDKNNLIFSVSAWNLKAENMIKLPVILTSQEQGWEKCVATGVSMRETLSKQALGEDDYIRPLVLIQAESKSGKATVEVVKRYLIEDLKVPESEIAIYTGSVKDFQGKELFQRNCPIKYVITVAALKEGWDCSFAYILCGLQNIQNSKDTEQLIGRILRMPYAKKRKSEELNKAYANICSSETRMLALTLQDRMVERMGFDRLDAQDILKIQGEPKRPIQTSFFDFCNSKNAETNNKNPSCERKSTVEILIPVSLEKLEGALKDSIPNNELTFEAVNQQTDKAKAATIVIASQKITSEHLEKLEEIAIKASPREKIEETKERLKSLRYALASKRAENLQQTEFKKIPSLVFKFDEEFRPVSSEAALTAGWNPWEFGISLEKFSLPEERIFLLDADEKGKFQANELKEEEERRGTRYFNEEFEKVSEQDLICWLCRDIRRVELTYSQLERFVRLVVEQYLFQEKHFSLKQLILNKTRLSKCLKELLETNYQKAKRKGFETFLFENACKCPEDSLSCFKFKPERYQPRRIYEGGSGARDFQKHYFSRIHDLRYKTPNGEETEEYQCAVAIDMNPNVKQWIRNIEKSEDSFRLPLASGYFYPDFVVELNDGRILVIEYKGAQLIGNVDTKEKESVGRRWEELNRGKVLFLMGVKSRSGLDIYQQIEEKIRS